tara:strand:+ start:4793 stop:5122 length:330 start_codon:yes stop_codon:yes gene_type:complete
MIHFTTDLRDTLKATNIIHDRYRNEIKESVISYEATDYFVVTDQETAENIAYDLDENNINYDAEQDCDECCGDGFYDVMNCHDSSNECCGGCYREEKCESCDSGKILFI